MLSIPLLQKYHHITILKWIYTLGFIFTLPFGWNQAMMVKWNELSLESYLSIGYVLLFVSCLTYLFNQYSLKRVNPATVSVFIFIQPIVATFASIYFKTDSMDLLKWLFGGIIFIGVYFVIKRK